MKLKNMLAGALVVFSAQATTIKFTNNSGDTINIRRYIGCSAEPITLDGKSSKIVTLTCDGNFGFLSTNSGGGRINAIEFRSNYKPSINDNWEVQFNWNTLNGGTGAVSLFQTQSGNSITTPSLACTGYPWESYQNYCSCTNSPGTWNTSTKSCTKNYNKTTDKFINGKG